MFSWRLNEEISMLLSDDNKHYNPLHKLSFKFHSLPSLPNYTAWQGGNSIRFVYKIILLQFASIRNWVLNSFQL